MATCEYCKKDMMKVKGCVESNFRYANGRTRSQVKFGDEVRAQFYQDTAGGNQKKVSSIRCHDCNCALGEIHHTGCDVEECPRCHGQLIMCDCELEDDVR